MEKLKSDLKYFFKYLVFFLLGGSIYFMIEILFRGYSHPSMFILGGICYILIGIINEYFPWEMYIETQTLIGTGIVLVLEFITGCIVNLWLGWNVWDYSDQCCNIFGQVCLLFAIIWIPIVLYAILLDDSVRHIFFKEEYPRYTSWIVKKIKSLKKK